MARSKNVAPVNPYAGLSITELEAKHAAAAQYEDSMDQVWRDRHDAAIEARDKAQAEAEGITEERHKAQRDRIQVMLALRAAQAAQSAGVQS